MQRVTSRAVTLLLALSFALSAYGKDSVIRFYTEIAAPFYWLDENDQPQGASLELATAVADKAKLNATVEHLAWARAYYEATSSQCGTYFRPQNTGA
ncbi:hypothetical protein [Alteromonas halophila]|uniref:Uncharacterized protein n=1 Tax=Alteromonas halophila TaxID=516698 RepID=A0A918JJJ8_9ALTE|nr:hypothetical protein [Alteromonas halophila]GGW79022.1 hypothetical protein GCM10007391_09620 [Alteromonas halophila]